MHEIGRLVIRALVYGDMADIGGLCLIGRALIARLAAIVCSAAFVVECSGRGTPARLRLLLSVLLAAATFVGTSARLNAQEVPTIEPRYTRLFGTDSLEISRSAMSPDGRWIVFGGLEDITSVHIWILPAGGGEPVRLTSGPHFDDGPVWFPNSDRIAFRSDRSGLWAIMTLPIDTSTGRPAGPPQQVTLEGSAAYFDVSPDGKSIAYTPVNEQGNRVIRIVPSTGGTARTVGEADTPLPIWAPDGESLYYILFSGGGASPVNESTLVRVSLDGATTDTVFTWPGRIKVSTFPNSGYVLRMVKAERDNPTLWNLATLEGRSLARFSLPERMRPSGFVKDDLSFLATMSEEVAPLQILPVDGGPGRPLTDDRGVDEPLAWTPDGERVLFKTELNGEDVLLVAPVAGGPMRQFRLPDDAAEDFTPVFSVDGRHVLYATGDPRAQASALKVLSLEDRRSWELSAAFHRTGGTGRGGIPRRDGEEFVYVEKRGDIYELRASPPEGPSRLLWSFGREAPGSLAPDSEQPYAASVYGDRILLARRSEGKTWLYVASAGESEARELICLDGALDVPMWSPDGRWIAATHWRLDTLGEYGSAARILFLEVTPSGELVGEPRYVGEPALAYWNLVWLPDSRGILAVGSDANVWLMPVDPDQKPVAVTRDDPNMAWNFVLSPDGRHIAYGSRRVRGSSLWLVDLSEALQAGGS